MGRETGVAFGTVRAALCGLLVCVAIGSSVGFAVLSAGVATASSPVAGSASRFCRGPAAVSGVVYSINGTLEQTLRGHVFPGDRVTATFTVPDRCQVNLRLSAFYEATPQYQKPNVEQVLAQRVEGAFGPGDQQSLGPVTIPSCNFQVDFVVVGASNGKGAVGTVVGGAAGTLIDADTGGATACAQPKVTVASSCGQAGAVVDATLLNQGASSDNLTVTRLSEPSYSTSVTVRAGGTTRLKITLGSLYSDTLSFADNQLPKFTYSAKVTSACQPPQVTASSACQTNGSPGERIVAVDSSPAAQVLTVSQGTTVLTTLALSAGQTATYTATYAEGQQVTFTVTGPGIDQHFVAPSLTCSGGTTTTTAPTGSTTAAPPVVTTPSTPPRVGSFTLPANSTPPTVQSGSAALVANPFDPAATAVPADGALAFTGLDVRALLAWAALISAIGAALVALGGRRKQAAVTLPWPHGPATKRVKP